jgi:hypothetical protein
LLIIMSRALHIIPWRGGQAEDLMKMAAGEKGGGDDGRAGRRPRRANHGEELLAKLRTKGMQSINFFFV